MFYLIYQNLLPFQSIPKLCYQRAKAGSNPKTHLRPGSIQHKRATWPSDPQLPGSSDAEISCQRNSWGTRDT